MQLARLAVSLAGIAFGLGYGCSSSPPKAVKHDCTSLTSGGCTCSSFTEGDQPAVVSECSPQAYPGTTCCATPGWPGMNGSKGSGTCGCMAPSTRASGSCAISQLDSNAVVSVSSCKFDGSVTAGGSSSSSGGSSSGSSSGSSGTATCTDTGYCSPSSDKCTCGTSCVHYGPGEYMCGFTCTKSSDCASRKDPVTGAAYGHCTPGLDTATMTYDGFCS